MAGLVIWLLGVGLVLGVLDRTVGLSVSIVTESEPLPPTLLTASV